MTLQELGQSIREQREAAGLSIEDVAARIKISTRILRSIEEGSMVGMPHAVYTKRFIRSFGTIIGYNPDDLNTKLDIVFPPESLEENRSDYGLLTRMEPPAYGGIQRIGLLLLVLVMLGGLAAGGWFVAKNYGPHLWSLIKQPFSAVSGPAANRTEGQTGPSSGGGVNGTSSVSRSVAEPHPALPVPTDARLDPANVSHAVPPLAVPPSASSPASSSTAHISGSENTTPMPPSAVSAAPLPGSPNQVLVTAREECWMYSRADGGKGREYTLRPGESFVLTYNGSLDLTLGNGGGVSVVHNGKNLGKAGKGNQRVDLHFPQPGN